MLLGQLDPDLPRAHYRVPEEVDFVGLPSYPSMLSLRAPLAMLASLRRFWRVLAEVEVVWLLGPHPLCLAFAALAALRRRRVALGVRQDFPAYVRSRHPGRRIVHLAGDLLELSYRLLSRRCPTVVVAPSWRATTRARAVCSPSPSRSFGTPTSRMPARRRGAAGTENAPCSPWGAWRPRRTR